jgi:hypothetical protein
MKAVVIGLGALGLSAGFSLAFAFNGPSNNAGAGAGALGVGAANNISIGTSTTQGDTELLIVASSSDTSSYAVKILNSSQGPILLVRNDGSLAIATGTFSAGSALTVNGTIFSTSGFTGTVSAANVTPNVFNGAAIGNYAFNGSLGVGTTTQVGLPQSLSVYGGGYFSGPIFVGTPTTSTQAATKGYVDSALAGGGAGSFSALTVTGGWALTGSSTASLNMNGQNITGVGKLTVTTVDPVYNIGGAQYATYGPESIGIMVTADGKGKLESRIQNLESSSGSDYQYVFDFANAKQGSDLWLFWQTIDQGQNMQNISLTLTPEGSFSELWYDVIPSLKEIVVHGDRSADFSYHLSAPRYDTSKWPNMLTATAAIGVDLIEK